MSVFHLLLRGRIAAPRNRILQNSIPGTGATPRADARKLSRPSPQRLPRHVPGSFE